MAGILLDTNALIWFLANEPLGGEALFSIGFAQAADTLFVSPISAWEAGLAAKKRNEGNRPNLGGLDASAWFSQGCKSIGAHIVPIKQRIALEAAKVPSIYGSGDPGDCFLIATARVKKLAVVTRDRRMIELSGENPDYLSVIAC
jgi:PIN domain nuclease of toxin-antitoxin system